ncbi:MAG: hypothetical protein U9N53_09310, partial [Bacteroidota bacterium]|nr:hypothetical protein [Bacteroidota bacterium]
FMPFRHNSSVSYFSAIHLFLMIPVFAIWVTQIKNNTPYLRAIQSQKLNCFKKWRKQAGSMVLCLRII